jgi:hypothetical protein
MPISKQTTPPPRPLRHIALDGSVMSAPHGQQGHWTYRGDPEPVTAMASRPPMKLGTPPMPAITRYSRSGEVERLLIGPQRTALGWLRSVLR